MTSHRTASLCLLGMLLAYELLSAHAPRAVADERPFNDLEICKLECGTKDFVIDLIAAGVWKKGDDQYKQYLKYEPKAVLRIPFFDQKRGHFLDDKLFTVSGAEYRRALASAKAYANYSKLDDDGQKRICREIFGTDDKPAKGTARFKAGIDKLKHLLNIILGEPLAQIEYPKP